MGANGSFAMRNAAHVFFRLALHQLRHCSQFWGAWEKGGESWNAVGWVGGAVPGHPRGPTRRLFLFVPLR